MGIFNNLFKSKSIEEEPLVIVSPLDGEILSLSQVPDEMFSQQIMGLTLAIKPEGEKVQICAPCDGVIGTIFPTGHAFGMTTAGNVEILVHIGINTVESAGQGFYIFDVKEGDKVSAETPIVEVNVVSLSKEYNLSTMLIVTNSNGHEIEFVGPGLVKKGENILN